MKPALKTYGGELATRLSEYRALGQKEASKQRPPPDASSPDQNETALTSQAEGLMAAEQHVFDSAVTEVSRGLVEARQKLVELRATTEQLLSDDSESSLIAAEMASHRPSLVRATEERHRTEVELKYFRAANGINDEARYPESMPWHFGVLAILIVIETLVNAFFYENSQGILGGVMVALAIALLNMTTALALGYGFRYKNLAAQDKKIVGWLCLIVFCVTTVFFNALFAAFRTEYQLVSDPSEFAQLSGAFQTAWPEAMSIFRADMAFKDFWSFLLFGIGLLLSGAAFYKGYTLDDRYPGHGAKDRAFRQASRVESEEQDKLRQRVKDLLHHRRAAVQAAMHEPTTQIGLLARRVADITNARTELEQRANGIQRDYSLVIGAYRQANTSVRTLPPPAYFREPTELGQRTDASGADTMIAELGSIQNDLKAFAETYRERLNAKVNSLQNTSALLLNETFNSFLAEVRKEAEENISRRTPTIHRLDATF
jgi:hypothetical protein